MANNDFGQRWPQPQRDPSKYAYEQDYGEKQRFQNSGRTRPTYSQPPQPYDEYGYDQNGYSSQGYDGYDRDYQERRGYDNPPYSGNRGGYHTQYNDHYQSSRPTQPYDDQYRREPDYDYGRDSRRPGQSSRRTDPPTPERYPKPRDRIIQDQPRSPDQLAWDNPFGAFPRKPEKGKKSLSLERNDLPPGSSRLSDHRPVTSPAERNSQTPGYQSANGSDGDAHPSQNAWDATRPNMPGSINGNGSYRNSVEKNTFPLPIRSGPPRTQSNQDGRTDSSTSREKDTSFDHANYHDRNVQGPQHGNGHYRSQSGEPQYNGPQSFAGNGAQNNVVQNGRLSMERGLPNFDSARVMTNENVNNIDQDNQQPRQPAYSRPTYQAVPSSGESPVRSHDQGQQELGMRSPLSEFAFDLPNSTQQSQPARRIQSPQELATPSQRFPPVQRAQTYPERPSFPEQANGQHPVRSASRPEVTRTRDDTYGSRPGDYPRYGPPPGQGPMPIRPHTSGGQQRDRRGFDNELPRQMHPRGPPNPNYRNGPAPGYGPGPGPMADRRMQRPPPPRDNRTGRPPNDFPQPRRGMTQGDYPMRGPPPGGPGSMPPPPVRQYDRRTSDDSFRQNGPQSNPESLPHHPVPVRPGHTNSSPAPPANPSESQPPTPRGAPNDTGKQPITVRELNNFREAFKNNPQDYALGLQFAKKLVEAASVLASENGTADPKKTASNRERYVLDAHKIVKKLVSAGYPDAMFYLADCHGQGLLGLEPDPREAFQLYTSAAKLNHPQAAYRVAVCCELGQDEGGGTRRDPLKAMQWYKRAATLGDAPAMYKIGIILLKGLLNQPKNPREGISWLKRAAERADRENPHALHELALLYESAAPSDYVIRDEAYALQLFQRASDLGYKYSQYRLGAAYEYGLLGCAIDARQSIGWYTRAAAQGEHQSELALSGWYLTGSEPLLQQNDTEAYLWARKAASSGLAKAEYAMGYYSEVGIGTTVNLEEAKRWYYRAAAQSFDKARARLEELKRGGPKMQKTRVSRSHMNKNHGDGCTVM